MIPNTKDRALESSGVTATGNFSISLKDSVRIMTILRDTLYSDKELAVLREYSANAWDAHREVKKNDVPIKVTIPTSMSPVLTIRDYGPGLSQDDVFKVYTQYGASTKRNSDNAVGMLGIGSKSAFAYSDSFTVTSWHGSMKRVYVAVLDKTEEGVINLLHEEACGPDETGVEIQVAVRPNDVLTFHNKARKLFHYFEPRPDINIDLPPIPPIKARLKHGTLIEGRSGENGFEHQWVAVMGCIPYRINVDQVRAHNNNGVGVAEYITQVSGILNFDIGAVDISASREELKYSDRTKTAIIEKFALMVDEFVMHTFDAIQKGNFTFWERRLKAQLLAALHLPIPKNFKSIVEDYVRLKHLPKLVDITHAGGTAAAGITVSQRAKLLLRDDARAMQHYHLTSGEYVIVRRDPNTSWDDVRAELDEFLKKNEIDGMPIELLSTYPWYPPAPTPVKAPKIANKKHAVTTFKLIKTSGFGSPYSDIWEIVKRVPHKDDVFVCINKFKGDGFPFFKMYSEDVNLAKIFGLTMPTVYGYKSTKKMPIDPAKCEGTEYREWREKFAKGILESKRGKKLYTYWEWAQGAKDGYNRSPGKKAYEKIRDRLGARHPLTKLFKKQQDGKRVTKNMKWETDRALDELRARYNAAKPSEYSVVLKEVTTKYPLLDACGLETLWGSDSDKWLDYVKLVDKA